MPVYVLRVWLPDRPGALGAVASRIGAVKGDVVGIDILERGAGQVIDELVVALPDEELVPLLVAEVAHVDGVSVEHVHERGDSRLDARLDALETAALLVGEQTADGLLLRLAQHAEHDFEADWAAVLSMSTWTPSVTVGAAPPREWLGAFASGSHTSDAVRTGDTGPDDVARAELPGAGLVLVLGRQGRPFRARERRQLTALTRIAAARWAEVSGDAPRVFHPSTSTPRLG